ncbi:unnamed protein product, partial [Amoebophrya sp. A25]|eukprot:GSA25T00020875001.1
MKSVPRDFFWRVEYKLRTNEDLTRGRTHDENLRQEEEEHQRTDVEQTSDVEMGDVYLEEDHGNNTNGDTTEFNMEDHTGKTLLDEEVAEDTNNGGGNEGATIDLESFYDELERLRSTEVGPDSSSSLSSSAGFSLNLEDTAIYQCLTSETETDPGQKTSRQLFPE